jgi:hypothetical protein
MSQLPGRIIASIFAVLAVIFFTLSAWNVAFGEALYSPSTYNAVLEDEQVFEDLLPVALQALMESTEEEGTSFEDEAPIEFADINEALSREEWRELTGLLVPPDWLQARADEIVTTLLSVAQGDLDVLENEVSLATVRDRLQGQEAEQAVELIFNAAPLCTQTQIDRIRTLQAGRSDTDIKLPVCNPADEDLLDFSTSSMRIFFNALAEMMPDESLTVSEFYDLETDDARILYLFGQIDNQSALLVYLCPLSLLSLIVVATVRSRKSFSRWVGTTGLIAGGVLFMTLLLVQFFLLSSVSELFQAGDEVSLFGARIFSAIARAMFTEISGVLLLQMSIFIIVGFVLVATSFFDGSDGDDSVVLVTEDGEIISTATQRRSSV